MRGVGMLGSSVHQRKCCRDIFIRKSVECVSESAVRQSESNKYTRSKGEIMFKAKIWVVAAAMVLVAFGAMASNFRVADQVYVPIAGHIQGGSSLFVSDIFISNLSTSDAVQVSIIYGPQNGKGNFQSFANRITLAANERKEFVDFFQTVLPEISNPFGLLVFNACKSGADCTPDPTNFENANFRPISVESRIYAIDVGSSPATAASKGQDMPGIPWYNFVSSSESAAGLAKVFITGFSSHTG